MTFLYFVPKQITTEVQNVQELHDAGITWIDPGDRFQSVYSANGPGGGGGAVVSVAVNNSTPGPTAIYRPAEQTWRKHVSGKFWVGIVTAQPPTPQTLMRSKPLAGTPVKLLDGNEWIIPRCISKRVAGMAGATLPMRLDIDDDDQIVGRPLPRYKPVADECFEFFQCYLGEIEYPASEKERDALFGRQLDLAIKLLSLNYRVGCRLEVLSLLGLFSSDEWRLPLRAAIEADAIDRAAEEAGKKLEAEGSLSAESGTSPGGSDATTPSQSTSATSS